MAIDCEAVPVDAKLTVVGGFAESQNMFRKV